MKLIVGLGNPGKEYKNTRHNIGFMVIDNYLGKVKWKTKMESYIYEVDYNSEKIIFVKPLTYMNLSGMAVSRLAKFYKIEPQDIFIIQDDLDLPFGKFKIKRNSSSGGHNGIKSIIAELNSDAFGRLKIGIEKNRQIPVDRYVLTKFTDEELQFFNKEFDTYNKIIDLFISDGIEAVLDKY